MLETPTEAFSDIKTVRYFVRPGTRVAPHDIATTGLALEEQARAGGLVRQEIDRACANAKVRLEICNETNSLAFAQPVSARTDLATFLPRDTAMPSIEAGRLVAVPLRDKRLEATQVTLVQLAGRNMSPSCRLVADLLIGRMKASRE